MSDDSESSTSSDSDSDNSGSNYIEEYEGSILANSDDEDYYGWDQDIVPYANEPIASKEWTEQYNKKKAEKEELRKQLQQRLDGVVSRESWCKCGNCKVDLLQDALESKCCTEIEECVEALKEEDVLADVGGSPPNCITLHPGFHANCLEKWVLKHSATKYKKRDQKQYKKMTEEKFCRAVAYKEFSQLAYGCLGFGTIQLPACAYQAIRSTFTSK